MSPTLLAQVSKLRVFVELDETLGAALDSFVEPTASNLMGTLQAVALLGATMYIMFVGFTIVFGADSTPVYTFIIKTSKMILVTAFALSADGYLGGLVAALNGLEDGLVSAVAIGEGGQISGNIFQVLDLTLSSGFLLAQGSFQQAEQAGLLSPGAAIGWVLTGLILGGATIIMVTAGGAAVLLSKFALAILFGLGPMFVLSLMFPQTAGFFDKWLAQVLSFVFQNVIIATILMLAINTFNRFIGGIFVQGAGPNPLLAALQIAALSAVYTYLLLKAGPLASSLSGGAAASLIDARQAAMGTMQAARMGAAGAAAGAAAVAGGLRVAEAAGRGVARVSDKLSEKILAATGPSSAAKQAAQGTLGAPVGSLEPGGRGGPPSAPGTASGAAAPTGGEEKGVSPAARQAVAQLPGAVGGAAPGTGLARVPPGGGGLARTGGPSGGGEGGAAVHKSAPSLRQRLGTPSGPRGLGGSANKGGVSAQRSAAIASFAARTGLPSSKALPALPAGPNTATKSALSRFNK